MIKCLRATVLAIPMFASTVAVPATVTEPGRNGQIPTQVAPNAAPGASPGSGMDAPGGVGPGFTNRNDLPPGLVAPGTIGKNGISPTDNAELR